MRKSAALRRFTAVCKNGAVFTSTGYCFASEYNWFVSMCEKLDTYMISVKVEFLEKAETTQLSLFI